MVKILILKDVCDLISTINKNKDYSAFFSGQGNGNVNVTIVSKIYQIVDNNDTKTKNEKG